MISPLSLKLLVLIRMHQSLERGGRDALSLHHVQSSFSSEQLHPVPPANMPHLELLPWTQPRMPHSDAAV